MSFSSYSWSTTVTRPRNCHSTMTPRALKQIIGIPRSRCATNTTTMTAPQRHSFKSRRHGRYKVTSKPNQVLSIVIRPKVAVQTYKTLTSSGYTLKRLRVNFGDASVLHYGLHLVKTMP